MTLEEIITGFDALTVEDFDWNSTQSHGWEDLELLCKAVRALPHPDQVTDVMFQTMERLSMADLGTPGPLVHTLETFQDYRPSLMTSFQCKPTSLTAWMINRILNATEAEADRAVLLDLLKQAEFHPLADTSVKVEVRGFVEYQESIVHDAVS